MLIQWSEEDRAFIVTLPEFNDAKTHGDTYAEAVREGKDLIDSFVMWYGQDGRPLPEPRLFLDEQEDASKKKELVASR